MNRGDLERMQQQAKNLEFRCAVCEGSAGCPMLHDELWDQVWRLARLRLAPLRCTCLGKQRAVHEAYLDHALRCELGDIGGRRQLLCQRCAEELLGYRIRLEHLMACVMNLHAAIEMRRRDSEIAMACAVGGYYWRILLESTDAFGRAIANGRNRFPQSEWPRPIGAGR